MKTAHQAFYRTVRGAGGLQREAYIYPVRPGQSPPFGYGVSSGGTLYNLPRPLTRQDAERVLASAARNTNPTLKGE